MQKLLKTLQNNLLPLALIAGALFPLGSLLLLYKGSQDLNEVASEVEGIRFRAEELEKKQRKNWAAIEHFSEADRFYIDKHIESIVLLEREIEALQKITKQSTFMDDQEVKNRLNFLLNENSLVFTEGVVQSQEIFKETVETLAKPVQVNLRDLQEILAKIEGAQLGAFSPPPNRPQLIITDLKLDRKGISGENEVFQLNLKLLKREFTDLP